MSHQGEKNRRERAKKQRLDYIKIHGGECQECGDTDTDFLEFHHAEPSSKVSGLSYMWGHSSKTRIEAELEKCYLLCKSCHARVSVYERISPPKHGTRSKYNSGCKCDACKKANRDYEYDRRYR